MKKPNLNSPATAEQCAAAHQAGVTAGNGEGLAIYLTVMRDKFGKGSRKLYDVWKATEAECEAISSNGKLIAQYEREQRELIKRDLCPIMADIAHAYKQPPQPIRHKDVLRCGRQGREAGWQFCTLVFLRAIRAECQVTKPQLKKIYAAACELRESIRQGYIKLADLEAVLLDEAGIRVA